ncbi:MAG: hypothetical protein ACRCWI_02530 [Brevinema sp.]
MALFFLLISAYPIYSQDFSFLNLRFGMTQDEVLVIIKNSKDLIPSEDLLLRQLITSTPYTLVLKANNSNNNMIQRVFIDFNQGTSYQITVFLNPFYFSFYSLSEKMLDLYGIPNSRTAQKVTWFDQNQEQRATLEYPATIKYTDMARFIEVLRLQEQNLEQQQSESVDYKARQRILNEL